VTWPDGIALACGAIAAYLIARHQHRSTTAQQQPDPQDGEAP
jgi:hypothetical protein